MKKEELYKQLTERYISGQASAAEVEVFFHLLNEGELDEYLDRATRDSAAPYAFQPVVSSGKWRRLGRLAVAAAVILLVGLGLLLWLRPGGKKEAPVVNVFKNEVAPGGNKALLTLADGTIIVLDSAEKGALASQGNARIIKVDVGLLSYKAGPAGAGARNVGSNGAAPQKGAFPVYYNTISTPAGGQYQVVLADGTKVWLNAESSLKFPTEFQDTVRTIALTGEAYFEVASNKSRPFRVKVGGMEVEVLGTKFNLNGYADEAAVKTTLLEGAVKLVKGAASLLLKPGEQGQSEGTGAPFILVKNADVEQAVAWRYGHFSFEGADVYTVMRQISRWYGVQVRYEGSPTRALFGGEIERGLNLTQVLAGLSKTNVHFRLEGKTLTVLP